MVKRILHILSSNSFSGAENVAITIIKNTQKDYKVAYASVEGPIRDILKKNSIEYLPMSELSVSEIRRIVKRWQPGIIHAHDFKASIKSGLATFRIPIVAHIHQSPEWFKSYNVKSLSVLLASIRFKKIIFVTPTLLDSAQVLKSIDKKIEVISNIIDVNEVYRKSKEKSSLNKFDIAYVGRLEEVKNPLRFIKIVKEVQNFNCNIRAVMVGDGSMKESCKDLITELGLEKNIELTGFLENPLVPLVNSDIYVMTSISEGLPLSVLEALSLGKPVLITKLDEIIKAIGNETLFVCETDYDFVERIKLLKNDAAFYEQKSVISKNTALDLFNMQRYMERFYAIYEELKGIIR